MEVCYLRTGELVREGGSSRSCEAWGKSWGVSATKPQSCSGGGEQSAEDMVGTQPSFAWGALGVLAESPQVLLRDPSGRTVLE